MNQSSRPALLTPQEVAGLVAALPGWQLSADGKSISRRFRFPGFDATVAFFNRVAALAVQQDHHPDAKVGYDYCEVLYTTHDKGGLTTLDAYCAKAVQAIADEMGGSHPAA